MVSSPIQSGSPELVHVRLKDSRADHCTVISQSCFLHHDEMLPPNVGRGQGFGFVLRDQVLPRISELQLELLDIPRKYVDHLPNHLILE